MFWHGQILVSPSWFLYRNKHSKENGSLKDFRILLIVQFTVIMDPQKVVKYIMVGGMEWFSNQDILKNYSNLRLEWLLNFIEIIYLTQPTSGTLLPFSHIGTLFSNLGLTTPKP